MFDGKSFVAATCLEHVISSVALRDPLGAAVSATEKLERTHLVLGRAGWREMLGEREDRTKREDKKEDGELGLECARIRE